jgi:hypothetical protein
MKLLLLCGVVMTVSAAVLLLSVIGLVRLPPHDLTHPRRRRRSRMSLLRARLRPTDSLRRRAQTVYGR